MTLFKEKKVLLIYGTGSLVFIIFLKYIKKNVES